jgi:DNA-binding MarR family transcriptional regulator
MPALRQSAVLAVLRTSIRMRRAYECAMRAHGLTHQQFNVLRILRGAERAGDASLPTMTVGERMVEPEPGITRLLGRLDDKGLVRRDRSADDARCVRCALTPAGRDVLGALDGDLDALNAEVLSGFTADDLTTLAALLGRILPDPPSLS